MLFPIKKKQSAQKPRPWRDRITLSQWLIGTSVLAILGASFTAGSYALNILYESKLVDTWAIMFLELEQDGTRLSRHLKEIAQGLDHASKASDLIFKVDKDGQIESLQGAALGLGKLSDLNIQSVQELGLLPPLSILKHGGQHYLVFFEPSSGLLHMRNVPSTDLSLNSERNPNQGSIYVMTREGRVLFTSDPSITEFNVNSRALVQKFIGAPFKQGQLEFLDQSATLSFGFFSETPDTNLIIFSEVSKAAILAPIDQMIGKFFLILLAIIGVVILVLQFPLSRITKPIKELVTMAEMIAEGHFKIDVRSMAFGELSLLNRAFSSMAKGLAERDLRLGQFMIEQAEKVRLEGEMAIARNIQENLLPTNGLPSDAGLSIATVYIPAMECAGDWYHYAYDPRNRESLMVIADVSGHGTGSAMFTAIIAGLFDKIYNSKKGLFPMEEFASAINGTMYRLGKQRWHATMFMLRYVAGASEMDCINAGHPQPLIKRQQKVESLLFKPSSVLGLDLNATYTTASVGINSDDEILLFTDGLIESSPVDGKAFGRRRVREFLQVESLNPHGSLNQAMERWKSYLGGAPLKDDVCVILARIA